MRSVEAVRRAIGSAGERALLRLVTVIGLLWRVRRPLAVAAGELTGALLVIVGVAMWSGRAAVVLTGLVVSFVAYRWDR